ncbi:recombinase family protein [Janibacter anophelis]|uniref:recombinase family protein n=1 Tax=Janibacter anophelis TaxID=319054 RepID=UPI0013B0572C|nr:recombinase family protein [Janibacter anophelis]
MTRTAGIYVRISSDPTGARLGVTRQRTACQKRADEHGWRVHRIYEDNDISAYSGNKPRAQYERLLADLEAGVIDAVIVWDLDRLTRRPIEIEQFIDLADRRAVALASVGGDVDLSTDNGRMFARIKGAVARAEIERKSARQRAANEQRRAAGRMHVGRRAFGYSGDGTEILEEEAAWIRKGVAALLAGATIAGIVRDFNAAGVTTTAGNRWHPTEARRMLASPRYAALLVHDGTVIGDGAWPAIITVDDHRAVLAVLDDPARRSSRPKETSALLVGAATCGLCTAPTAVYSTRSASRARYYYCSTKRHLSRASAPIDEYVTDAVLERLSRAPREDLLDPLDPTIVASLRANETTIRARLDGIADAYAAGDVDELQLRRVSTRLRGDLERVTAELTSLSRRPAVAALLEHDDLEHAWHESPVAAQRAILASLATVRLHSPGRGARRFNPETVEVAWT